MSFRDRRHAAELLAARLGGHRGRRPLVLAIPRGAVPMARILAEALDGDLDVVLVRKLGAPGNPELAVGAVAEGGDVLVAPHAVSAGAGSDHIAREARAQLEVIRERRRRIGSPDPPLDPAGRDVIVVDDGIATGSTMRAALAAVRARRPARLTAAVGVAPPSTVEALREEADEVVALETPETFRAVGQFFGDFSPVGDDEVVATLRGFWSRRAAASRGEATRADDDPVSIEIPSGDVRLAGDLSVPDDAAGLVVFAHGSGSSRKSPRNVAVARHLRRRGLATLLADLLTEEEDAERAARFDIGLLTERLVDVVAAAREREETAGLPVGLFGASTGAACALRVGARLGDGIAAIVSRGGRPDLAGPSLPFVLAPTLLVVGGADRGVIELNEAAFARLLCERRLEIVPGATHLFEEPGALERVAELAGAWFVRHFAACAAGSARVGRR
jgi:predicted phosphoribosyltransferase/dienelactone hydrolase